MSNKTMPDNQNDSNLDQQNDPTSTPHSSKELELEEEQQELAAAAASPAEASPAWQKN